MSSSNRKAKAAETVAAQQQLAAELGVNVRTVQRDRKAGMPRQRRGETIPAWAARVRAWREASRQRPGPKTRTPSDAEAAAMVRYRLAKAELAEIELARVRGDLHSRQQCDDARVRQCAEISGALRMLPDTLARKLYQAPSPDAIKLVVQEELRRALAVLTDDEPTTEADSGPAAAAS
ncbi:MAG: hypothetical protein JNL08_05815 [Planctomycetes bacterium]|nr:hypothetical protein [Planctomycetota bacterium]